MSDPAFPDLSYPEAETALCIYEDMLDHRDEYPGLDEAWDNAGSFQMRNVAIRLAGPVEALWRALPDDIRSGPLIFDWEFIPLVLSVLDWSQIVDVASFTDDPIPFDPAPILRRIKLDHYREQVGHVGGRRWGYAGINVDAPEKVEQAFEEGQPVAEFVEWYGKKYDLIEPDPFTAKDLQRTFP